MLRRFRFEAQKEDVEEIDLEKRRQKGMKSNMKRAKLTVEEVDLEKRRRKGSGVEHEKSEVDRL